MDLSELMMARAYTGGGSGGGAAKMYVIEVASQSGDDITAHIVDTDTGHYLTPSDLFVDEGSPRLKNMFNLMIMQPGACMYFSVLSSVLDGTQQVQYIINAMNYEISAIMIFIAESWDSEVWLVEEVQIDDQESTDDGEAQGDGNPR